MKRREQKDNVIGVSSWSDSKKPVKKGKNIVGKIELVHRDGYEERFARLCALPRTAWSTMSVRRYLLSFSLEANWKKNLFAHRRNILQIFANARGFFLSREAKKRWKSTAASPGKFTVESRSENCRRSSSYKSNEDFAGMDRADRREESRDGSMDPVRCCTWGHDAFRNLAENIPRYSRTP